MFSGLCWSPVPFDTTGTDWLDGYRLRAVELTRMFELLLEWQKHVMKKKKHSHKSTRFSRLCAFSFAPIDTLLFSDLFFFAEWVIECCRVTQSRGRPTAPDFSSDRNTIEAAGARAWSLYLNGSLHSYIYGRASCFLGVHRIANECMGSLRLAFKAPLVC